MLKISQSNNNKATVVTIGDTQLLFSYETLVAFQEGYGNWIVSENVWGPTTGKHINNITGVRNKEDRMPRAEFVALTEKRFTSI